MLILFGSDAGVFQLPGDSIVVIVVKSFENFFKKVAAIVGKVVTKVAEQSRKSRKQSRKAKSQSREQKSFRKVVLHIYSNRSGISSGNFDTLALIYVGFMQSRV